MQTIEERAQEWFDGLFSGPASKTIWAVMMGKTWEEMDAMETSIFGWNWSTPGDVISFDGCGYLLEEIPEWKERLSEMNVFPEWRPFVRDWDKLMDRPENLKYTEKEAIRLRLTELEGVRLARSLKEEEEIKNV